MTRSSLRPAVLVFLAFAAGGLLLGGCGEKITIPQPIGDFGTSAYVYVDSIPAPDARQVAMDGGGVYVLTPSVLEWRNLEYGVVGRLEGLEDATAFCIDGVSRRFFIYEAGPRRVRVFGKQDDFFDELAVNPLPDTETVTHIATCRTGVGAVPGAVTFLYLADETAGVVHRYACDATGSLTPYGILARSGGVSARFVNLPRGMVEDDDDFLLVCDADPSRNWVIRFDPTPDLEDGDDLRGVAAVFPNLEPCYPEPSPADYVLGDAAGCDPEEWEPAPTNAVGVLLDPVSVAIDGVGDIYVADRLNNRIQRFSWADTDSVVAYGGEKKTPAPFSIAVWDERIGAGVIYYGAHMFLLVEGPSGTELRRYWSREYYKKRTASGNYDPE